MNEPLPDLLRGVAPDLATAVRRARLEQAQRSDAVAGIQSAEIARLELLHDAVRPILAQVPAHVDMFDAAVSHGDHPRLFIDMIGFVELARDGRGYRLIQDTRHGRLVMAQTHGLAEAVEAVAAYIARRLVEREKALAGDTTIEGQDATGAAVQAANAGKPAGVNGAALVAVTVEPLVRHHWRMRARAALRFVIQFLGTATLLCILLGVGFLLYHAARTWLTAHYGFAPE